ncbi:MAG: thiamine-phosphate pyrophosphorylase [Solirubrobacteraceae bacterium]|jgi:thiamine-phosphate pyrophosphorylase|nr:thiamine-phosphate pyrophosphorylase [Solirubrobacteraceae bacterium]
MTVSNRQQRLAGARLYFVCAAQPDSLLHDALAGGVDIVQLRIKHGSDEEILTAARRFRAVCDEHGALLIINDRPDLAVAVGADGVHVGQDDISVAAARAAVGPERLVGLSTHTAAQVDAANQAGIDYIGVGPVHATPTKPGRPAVGLDLVRHAAVHSSVPFFAIGGVDPGTVAAVREAGARRVAVVRALSQARDPQATARELRATLSDPRTDAHAA